MEPGVFVAFAYEEEEIASSLTPLRPTTSDLSSRTVARGRYSRAVRKGIVDEERLFWKCCGEKAF